MMGSNAINTKQITRDDTCSQNNFVGSVKGYNNDLCRVEYAEADGSTLKCLELARSLICTMDLLKDYASSTSCNKNKYFHLITELVAVYISSELIYAHKFTDKKPLIANRVVNMLYKHMSCSNNEQMTTENILRVLILIPKLYDEREIMSKIYQQLIPGTSALLQKELPDKLYVQHLILFYQWKELMPKHEDQICIIEFADRFMRPMKTLATNILFAYHLPRYNSDAHATKYILENLSYDDLRKLSDDIKIIDNCDNLKAESPSSSSLSKFFEQVEFQTQQQQQTQVTTPVTTTASKDAPSGLTRLIEINENGAGDEVGIGITKAAVKPSNKNTKFTLNKIRTRSMSTAQLVGLKKQRQLAEKEHREAFNSVFRGFAVIGDRNESKFCFINNLLEKQREKIRLIRLAKKKFIEEKRRVISV